MLVAPLFPRGVRRLRHAVGVKDERVAGGEGAGDLVVARVAEAAQDDARGDDLLGGFAAADDRRRVSGGCSDKRVGGGIDMDVRRGDELAFQAAAEERIEGGEDASG